MFPSLLKSTKTKQQNHKQYNLDYILLVHPIDFSILLYYECLDVFYLDFMCFLYCETSDPTLVLRMPRLVLVPMVVKMEWTTVKAVNRRPGRVQGGCFHDMQHLNEASVQKPYLICLICEKSWLEKKEIPHVCGLMVILFIMVERKEFTFNLVKFQGNFWFDLRSSLKRFANWCLNHTSHIRFCGRMSYVVECPM